MAQVYVIGGGSEGVVLAEIVKAEGGFGEGDLRETPYHPRFGLQ